MEANDTRELETKTLGLPEQAKSIQVIDQVSLTLACGILTAIKSLRKQIDETFDPGIKKAYEAHKAAVALKKHFEAPITLAESTIKPKIAAFHDQQERLRREEESRNREEARKRAEEEQLAHAVAAEQMGMTAEADVILQQPAYAPTVIAPKAPVAAEGISMRKTWKFNVVDPILIPREFLMVDEQKISGYVRAMKEQAKIPGVEVYCESSVAARGAV